MPTYTLVKNMRVTNTVKGLHESWQGEISLFQEETEKLLMQYGMMGAMSISTNRQHGVDVRLSYTSVTGNTGNLSLSTDSDGSVTKSVSTDSRCDAGFGHFTDVSVMVWMQGSFRACTHPVKN